MSLRYISEMNHRMRQSRDPRVLFRSPPPMCCGPVLLAFACIVIALFRCPEAAAEANEVRHILLLHSYHQGFAWTDNITQGIRTGLKNAGMSRYELHISYMDARALFRNLTPP